jgi:flagellar protein FliS
MNATQSIRRYQESDVGSMSREKMVALLYEKMIGCFQRAEEALARNDRVAMADRVNLAQRIVTELRNALDFDIGGEIATNLEAIYDFVFHENLQVLVDRNPSHLRNCTRVLSPLLESWRQIPPGSVERAERERQEATGGGPDTASDSSRGADPPSVEEGRAPDTLVDRGSNSKSLLSISA